MPNYSTHCVRCGNLGHFIDEMIPGPGGLMCERCVASQRVTELRDSNPPPYKRPSETRTIPTTSAADEQYRRYRRPFGGVAYLPVTVLARYR